MNKRPSWGVVACSATGGQSCDPRADHARNHSPGTNSSPDNIGQPKFTHPRRHGARQSPSRNEPLSDMSEWRDSPKCAKPVQTPTILSVPQGRTLQKKVFPGQVGSEIQLSTSQETIPIVPLRGTGPAASQEQPFLSTAQASNVREMGNCPSKMADQKWHLGSFMSDKPVRQDRPVKAGKRVVCTIDSSVPQAINTHFHQEMGSCQKGINTKELLIKIGLSEVN